MLLPRIVIAAIFELLASAAFSSPAAAKSCLGAIEPALVSGGFSGSVDCKKDELALRKIGTVRSAGRIFAIYDYRYRLAPACKGCARRGGQRIIFMSKGRYIGQYKPNRVRGAIERGKLILTPITYEGALDGPPVAIKFTHRGPPERVWFDWEVHSLFR